MRRLTIGLTFLVMILLVASVAGAVPPNFCDDKPDHPQCPPPDTSTTTTTSATTTTTEAPSGLAACDDQMVLSGGGSIRFECLWAPISNGSPTGAVTISEITGAIPDPPFVFVRDDSPGDICVEMQDDDWAGQTGPEYVAEFDLFYDEVPEGYEAWLGYSYWNFIYEPGSETGTHWCAPQDPVLGVREDNNGGALHLQISFNARGGGSLMVSLYPGNSL